MDLLQLTYFRTVASLEHMTKAAEVLHVSQPSLSRTISNLEKELGVELFYRTGRKITLNRYGRAFLSHVNLALDELQAGRDELFAMGRSDGPIIVSCIITGIITDLIDSYHRLSPSTLISFRMDPYEKFQELLQECAVDFIISDLPTIDFSTDGWTTVSKERLYILAAKDHPLAAQNEVTLSQLCGEQLALPESSAPIRRVLDHFFKIANVSLQPAYEINDVYAQLHIVNRGSAISLIPTSALFDIISKRDDTGYRTVNQIRAVPVAGKNITWDVGISPLSGRSSSPAVRDFHQHCVKAFAQRREDMKRTIDSFCAAP